MKGIHRYETFGLHAAWVGGFLGGPSSCRSVDCLGPRQRLALKRYLQDAGICDRTSDLTPIGCLLSETVGDPRWSEYAWPCIWTFLCTTAPVFRWYATLPNRVWTLEELSWAMHDMWPGVSPRTLYNARLELLGTLRYTPIGEGLGQGIRVGTTAASAVEKRGPDGLSAYWALFGIAVMCPHGLVLPAADGHYRSDVAQVLGVSDGILSTALESLWQPDLFTVSRDGGGFVHADLRSGVTPETVLRRWINQQ